MGICFKTKLYFLVLLLLGAVAGSVYYFTPVIAQQKPEGSAPSPEVLTAYRNQFRNFEVTGFIENSSTATKDNPAQHVIWQFRYRQIGDRYFSEALEIFRNKQELPSPKYESLEKEADRVVVKKMGSSRSYVTIYKPEDANYKSAQHVQNRVYYNLIGFIDKLPEASWDSVERISEGVYRSVGKRGQDTNPSDAQYTGEKVSLTYTSKGTPLMLVAGDPGSPRFVVRWENPQSVPGLAVPVPRFAHSVYWFGTGDSAAAYDTKLLIRSIKVLNPDEPLVPQTYPIGTEIDDRIKGVERFEGGELGADEERLLEDIPSKEAMLNAPLAAGM